MKPSERLNEAIANFHEAQTTLSDIVDHVKENSGQGDVDMLLPRLFDMMVSHHGVLRELIEIGSGRLADYSLNVFNTFDGNAARIVPPRS